MRTTTFAGVSKKRGQKKISSRQRKRQEASVAKAERIMSRTERKVEESLGRAKMIDERRNTWDALNDKIEVPVDAAASMVVEMRVPPPTAT